MKMLTKSVISFFILCLVNLQITDAKGCSDYLRELAASQKDFLQCVTTHSVPVKMCQGCKNEYDIVLKSYDLLVSECNTTYFDKDRLNLVPSTQALLTGIWTKGYCDDCFNNNNSYVFRDKYTEFYGCLGVNPKDKQCDKCKNVYMDLNTFYISLDQHNNGEVCFDLQDAMNRTRYKWSKELQCCLREYNTLYFSIALSITTFIIFTFYFSTYLITKRQERNHGLLNDEDPVFNSPAPSTTIAHLNISNHSGPSNQSTTNELNDHASSSENVGNNKISKAKEQQDLDSSDEELLIKTPAPSFEKVDNNKITKAKKQ